MTTTEQQDGGRGFLERCVAGTSSNAAVEAIRERGTEVVLSIYRLVKIGLIHSFDNDAVGKTLDQTRSVLQEFSGLAGGAVTVTFADDTVFVCGQLLRGSRSVFESAAELGALLARCGVSELRFEPSMTRADLGAAAQAITACLREGATAPRLAELRIPNIVMQKVDAVAAKGREGAGGASRRPLDYYASSLVVMRRFFDDLAAGMTVLPHRVKRIAQGLVGLSETEGPGLLGLTALANAHRDDAGRALQSAIIAIAIGRELTSDRATVARMAMAALLADVGRVRLAGKEGRNRLVNLDEALDRQVPAMAGAISIGTSGVNAQSALHTVIVYETTWLEREAELGPLHGGAPAAPAREGGLPRARDARPARAEGQPAQPVGPRRHRGARAQPSGRLDAFALAAEGRRDDPVGSIVELDTGAWAVVVGPSENPRAHDRPRVRVVIDSRGAVVEPPEEWDLGDPPAGVTYRIVRNLPREEARFNAARALV